MTRGQQHDLGPIRGLRPRRVHVRGERGLGSPEIEPGEGSQRLAQRGRVGRHERRQLVEDSGDLLGLRDLCLAPRVAELDRHERFDEQGLAASRGVVDDALDPAARLGLDRHHVAAVPQRDDGLLERRAELVPDQRIEPSSQPVVGDANGGTQSTEPRGGRVEHLPDRIEAARQRRSQRRQRVQFASQLVEEGAPIVDEDGGQPRRRIEGLGKLEELERLQAAATGRPLDPRPDVARRADADARPVLDQRPRLVRLVEAAGDHDRIGARARAPRPDAAMAEGGRVGQPGTDQGELEQGQRPAVHLRRLAAGSAAGLGASGPRRADTDRLPRTTNRQGRDAHGSPAYATPIRAVATTSTADSPRGAGSSRSGETGSHRSSPCPGGGETEGGGDQPRPAGQPMDRKGRQPGALRGGAIGRHRTAPVVAVRSRSTRMASMPSSGSTARMSRAAGCRRAR